MYKRTYLDFVFLFIKGIFMGAANKVPGVSGGIVALVTGFYEELIYSFQKLNGKAFLLLRKGKFKAFFNYTNARFLLAVNAGSVFSYFSVSFLLNYLIQNFEVAVWSFFSGMILGSIYYIAKDLKTWNWRTILPLVFGLSLGLLISFSNPLPENRNLLFVFICGIISVSGMTLPGLSGSFILILLGNYTLLLVRAVTVLFDVIARVFQGDFGFWYEPETMEMITLTLVFGIASVVGLVSFSHALGYLLKNFRNQVLALLIGFIAGSLGAVWPWKNALNDQGEIISKQDFQNIATYTRFLPELEFSLFGYFISMLLGIGVILLIDYYEKRKAIV